MDDYFYPYRIAGKEFPDANTYKNMATGLQKMHGEEATAIVLLK